jgi:hypothetical protein
VTYLIEGCHAKFGHPLVLIGIFGLSVPSFARDVSIGKHTAEEVKRSATKSAGNFHKTQRDIIVEAIVMVALAPIASLAAKPARHASPT